MPRPILDEADMHPAVRDKVARHQQDIVAEVRAAVAANRVVVVGMAGNPFCRRVRKTLDAAGVPFAYLEYGSYLSQWRRRNALKMWTGWPTLPMAFVAGKFVGGAEDVRRLAASGELKSLIAG